MINGFLYTIKKYNMLSKNDHVIAGVSGGADSVALLRLLLRVKEKYRLSVTAVHVNHCIRGADADADEAFVAELCAGLGVPLERFTYDVPAMAAKSGTTVENAGRNARYEAFRKVFADKNAQKIAIAHHENDNAETFLMRLCRGSSLAGLSSIQPVNGEIIRPLLFCKRNEIEKFLEDNGFPFVTDETNFNDKYTRNFIRLKLIPLIEKELNPSIVETLSKTASLCGEDAKYLESIAEAAYADCAAGENCLDAEKLRNLPGPVLTRVLRLSIANVNGSGLDITYEHIMSVCGLIYNKSGITVNLLHNISASLYYNKLYLRNSKQIRQSYCYYLPTNKIVYVPEIDKSIGLFNHELPDEKNACCAKIISCDTIAVGGLNNLRVRNRKDGDRILINSMGGHKKISDYFKDNKIPRPGRDKIALITNDTDVIMILDDKYIVSDKYKTKLENIVYVYIWEKNTII